VPRKDPIKRKEWEQNYQKTHKEEIKARRRLYDKKHRKDITERKRLYREKRKAAGIPANNPETLAAYRENHREKRSAYYRAYYAAHKAEINAANKAWQERHREKVRKDVHTYARSFKGRFVTCVCAKARKRNIPVTLTLEQYVELVRRNHCAYCGGDLPPAGSGLDRKNSSLGYTFENCVACCRACNEIRGHDNITYPEMVEVAKFLRSLRRKQSGQASSSL